LIAGGADLNGRAAGAIPLVTATFHGHEEIVRIFLAERADVTLVGGAHNTTALSYARRYALGRVGQEIFNLLQAATKQTEQERSGAVSRSD